MQYVPKLSTEEIEENHKHFIERISLYRKKGLDFDENRKFILEKIKPLKGNILEIGVHEILKQYKMNIVRMNFRTFIIFFLFHAFK